MAISPDNPFAEREISPGNPFVEIPSLEDQVITPTPDREEYDPLYFKTGRTRSERERDNAILREAMQVPLVSPERATRAISSLGEIGATGQEDLQQDPVSQGISEELGGAVSGMTSGEGATSLPLYAFPGTAAPLIEPSVEEIPKQVQDVIDSAQGGTPKEVAANTTKALLNILTTAGVAHGASRAMGPRPGPWLPERPPVSQLIAEQKASRIPPPIPPEYAQRQFTAPGLTSGWEMGPMGPGGELGEHIPVGQPEPRPPLAPAPGLEQTLKTAEQAAPAVPQAETTADVSRRVIANRTRILSEIEALRPQVMQARTLMPNGHPQLEAQWQDLNAQLNDKATNPVVHAPPESAPLPGLRQEGFQPLPQEARFPRGGPAVEPGAPSEPVSGPGRVKTAEPSAEAAKYGGPAAAREALRQQVRRDQANRIKLKIQKDGGFVSKVTMEDIRNLGKDIYEWGMDFHQWAAEMLTHLGKQVAAHLQDIWKSIQATAPYRAWEEITGGRLRKPLDLSKPENFELVDRVVPLDTAPSSLGRDFGIPEGMIEEGLNTEFPEIAAALDRYVMDNDVSGLQEALGHERYPEYKQQLDLLLRNSYGNKPVPVIRIKGYTGGTGEGAGPYESVSTNPFWGKASGAWEEGRVTQGAVDPHDVVAAGGEAEGELIIKKGSMMKPSEVPMEPHEQFVKGGLTARELPKRVADVLRPSERGSVGRTGGPRKEYVSVDSNGDRHTGEWDPDLRVVPKFLATAPKEEANLFRTKNILGTKSDPKTVKGEKYGVSTYISYLQAEKGSGVVNMCVFATENCTKGCLGKGGNARYDTVVQGRVNKTKYFAYDPVTYMRQLDKEIVSAKKRAAKTGNALAIRLNGTSDVLWEKSGIFERHPDVQFYDYTKYPQPLRQNLPPNYDLTYSYTGTDASRTFSERWNKHGVNTAVVFRDGMPAEFLGRPVVDGDVSDLRFLDPKGVIVGLHAKGELLLRDEHGNYVETNEFVYDTPPEDVAIPYFSPPQKSQILKGEFLGEEALGAMKDLAPKAGDLKWKRGNPDLGLNEPGATPELSPIQAFRERLRARREAIRGEGRQLSALGFDPEDTALQAAIGGTYIAEGVTDFAKWSAAMVKEFGPDIEPHLTNLWKSANAAHQQFQQTGNYTSKPQTPSTQEAPVGVRNETLRAREDAGLSTAPPPGIGVSWKDSVNRGNKALDAGADPYKILSDFQKDSLIGHPRLDPVRAWLERLQRANSEAHGALEADPQNPALAAEALRTQALEDEFAAAYQPMKTEWSRSGTGMQEERGITDSDLLSQKTAEQTMRDHMDRELNASDKARAADAVKRTRKANADTEAAFTEALDHAEKAAKAPPMTPEQMKAHFAERIKQLTPC